MYWTKNSLLAWPADSLSTAPPFVFRFFWFIRVLGFNVRTVARGTLDTRMRSRRRPARILIHALSYVERYKIIATIMNSNKFTEFDMKKSKF